MKMSFNIKTPNLRVQEKAADEIAKEVLFRSMVKMEGLAKMRAPVDTGNLKNRIHLTPIQRGARTYTLSDGVEYGVYVEYGTKPHYVPIAPLMGWSGRVLGDKNAGYAIRANIAKYGTPAQPFFRPAFDEVRLVWVPKITKQVIATYYGRT